MTKVDLKAAPVSRPISIGSVLAQLLAVVLHNWLAFYGVSLVFTALSLLKLFERRFVGGTALTAVNVSLVVLSLLGSVVAQAAMTHGTMQVVDGGRFALREAIGEGLRRLIPFAVAGILFYLAIGLGLVLLVIPAVFAVCLFSQAPTLTILERLGPIRSFARSRALTRGNRWRVLAVIVVVYLPWLLLYAGLFTFGVVAAATGRVPEVAKVTSQLQGLIIAMAFLLSPFVFAWPAVLYAHLRRAEGGAGPAGLAEVFA